MVEASPSKLFVRLSQAGFKRARSWFRSEDPNWALRAEICSRCPLSVSQCGKLYCGKPFLRQIDRHEPTEGCGCPVKLKAKDPDEHCPRNAHYDASSKDEACDCVWCVALRR
jgi:hypothetical protein